jgi:pimeloyl-ACP methyl ester carboxylesterase
MWQRAGYLRALPDRRQLLFDQRGHGHSDHLPGLGHLEAFWRADLTAPAIAEFLAERAPA